MYRLLCYLPYYPYYFTLLIAWSTNEILAISLSYYKFFTGSLLDWMALFSTFLSYFVIIDRWLSDRLISKRLAGSCDKEIIRDGY